VLISSRPLYGLILTHPCMPTCRSHGLVGQLAAAARPAERPVVSRYQLGGRAGWAEASSEVCSSAQHSTAHFAVQLSFAPMQLQESGRRDWLLCSSARVAAAATLASRHCRHTANSCWCIGGARMRTLWCLSHAAHAVRSTPHPLQHVVAGASTCCVCPPAGSELQHMCRARQP